MNYQGAASSFMKKLFKKQSVYENKKLSIVYYYPLIILKLYKQIFIFRLNSSLNFTRKCIGGQIKALSFFFCTACDAKSTKCRER